MQRRLAEHELESLGGGARLAEAAYVVEGLVSVNLRLAGPQEVEVGAAQHIDRFRHSAPPSIPASCNGRGAGSQACAEEEWSRCS